MSAQQQSLKRTVDRMVEDAIRRILPEVMNEVLLQTIARSGVMNETAQEARRQSPKQTASAPRKRSMRPALTNLLDEEAGTEFYSQNEQPERAAMMEEREHVPVARRVQELPSHLKALAADMDLSDMDDDGSSWDDPVNESAVPTVAGIADPLRAGKSIGLDFASMARNISATSPGPKRDALDDLKARAQFEEQRIKRDRERLNGGKPL